MIDAIFAWSVKNKQTVINFFFFFYAIVIIFLLISYYFTVKHIEALLLYIVAIYSAKSAIILLAVVTSPGITRRLNIRHKIFNLVMLFRRQLGVSVYLLVLIHFSILRLFPYLTGATHTIVNPVLFELIGLTAFSLLNLMFFTSNDYMVRTLGPWWQRIHRIIYVIVWLIFFHVFLQSSFIYATIVGTVGVLEIISWGYFYYKKSQPLPSKITPPQV